MTALQAREDAATIRRRKAVSFMADMICQHSPIMSAYRDEGRRMKELCYRLHVLHQAGEDSAQIGEELEACFRRQIDLLRWVDWAWAAHFAHHFADKDDEL
jgi:hypothetical protein